MQISLILCCAPALWKALLAEKVSVLIDTVSFFSKSDFSEAKNAKIVCLQMNVWPRRDATFQAFGPFPGNH